MRDVANGVFDLVYFLDVFLLRIVVGLPCKSLTDNKRFTCQKKQKKEKEFFHKQAFKPRPKILIRSEMIVSAFSSEY
jgi:hypothetical protein